VVLAAVAGSWVVALASLLAGLASFRSAAVLVGFTVFWEGVYVLFLSGIGLLFAAFAWQAIPNLVGRELASTDRALGIVRLIIISGIATGVLLVLAGIVSGLPGRELASRDLSITSAPAGARAQACPASSPVCRFSPACFSPGDYSGWPFRSIARSPRGERRCRKCW
jgi:hypothetical protein